MSNQISEGASVNSGALETLKSIVKGEEDGKESMTAQASERAEGDAEEEKERELPYAIFFMKVFVMLFLNFFISTGAIYGLVTAALFRKPQGILISISIVAAVASYGLLFYVQKVQRKAMLVTQVILLYVFMAACCVLVAYHASHSPFSGAIILYGLVCVTFTLLCLFIFTLVSRTCIKQGAKRWYSVALLFGIVCPLIYLSIVLFAGRRPIALPNSILGPIVRSGAKAGVDRVGDTEVKFSLWRKLVLFIGAEILSIGFLLFLLGYAFQFIRNGDEAVLTGKSPWLKLVVDVYVYLALPLVAVGYVVMWILRKIAEVMKKKRMESASKDEEKEDKRKEEKQKETNATQDEENPAEEAVQNNE